ncbi:MAG: translation initiation factor IF-3 [Thiohalorhabdus sp.]|uniref:translation initiation factor IF-3 n=1 Tax=Thiohalorhabdus sp. TaxID=3094134 RepID=UPI00397F094F
MAKQEKQPRVNEDIEAEEVRLVDAEGEQVGVVSLQEAFDRADEAGLDLVEVSPQAEPPVCKIMDYGKYKYEASKQAHRAKAKTKQVQLKEVKFRPKTDQHDYQVKLKNAIRFLKQGDRVKVTMRFRGREMLHQDIGRGILQRIEEDLAEYGKVEQQPKLEGRQMIMVVTPIKHQ